MTDATLRHVDENGHAIGVTISQKAREHLLVTDSTSPEWRALIHEFGFTLVNQFWKRGVKTPHIVRELIIECWIGAREGGALQSQSRGGVPGRFRTLDWLMVQNGGQLNVATLNAILEKTGSMISPLTADVAMIDASVEAFQKLPRDTAEREEHRVCINAALACVARVNRAAFKNWRAGVGDESAT